MRADQRPFWRQKSRCLIEIYPDEEAAKAVAKRRIRENFPMNLICVLRRVRASGDDPLGIYCLNAGERLKT